MHMSSGCHCRQCCCRDERSAPRQQQSLGGARDLALHLGPHGLNAGTERILEAHQVVLLGERLRDARLLSLEDESALDALGEERVTDVRVEDDVELADTLERAIERLDVELDEV